MKLFFLLLHPLKRNKTASGRKNMRKTSPAIHTIRFRRWSRKAYAAFASIGRCITIGYLRKSVADSSLSKQKAAGIAGHAGCGEESAKKEETEGRETDIGIPLGSSAALTSILTKPGMNRHILFTTQVIHPCGHAGGQDKHILKQEKTRGTDHRKPCSRMTSCTARQSVPLSLSKNLIQERYDNTEIEGTSAARQPHQ